MRFFGLRHAILAFVFAPLALSSFAQKPSPTASLANPNRIPDAPSYGAPVALPGHIPAWATPAADSGPVADTESVRLIFDVTRAPAVQAAYDRLLVDQQNPASSAFHQWLTPQQVGQQFGPTQHDLDLLTNWLTAQGFTVETVYSSHVHIQVSAPASVASAALHTSLHNFSLASGNLRAPVSEPMLPAALAPVVHFIAGLSTVPLHSNLITAPAISNEAAGFPPQKSTGTPGAPALTPNYTLNNGLYHWISASDFAILYDVNPVYSAGINGTGQKVMIIGGSRLVASDLAYFESLSALPNYVPNYIIPPSLVDPGTTMDGNMGEGTLDFNRVFGTAPGAQVDMVISKNWLSADTDTLQLYAINTVNDPVMSMSYGGCEVSYAAYARHEDSLFSQAAMQGISVYASSGDSGVAGCEPHGSAPPSTQYASVQIPCDSQYITCVGGTQFSDTGNPAAYWSSSNSSARGSVLTYIPEGAWNEPSYINNSGATVYTVAATSGGPSTAIFKPTWQTGSGVPADGVRDVPDISFSASGHNAYFSCLSPNANCVPDATGRFSLTGFGGTSASAPSAAGMSALLNQKLGKRMGLLNPTFYTVAGSTSNVFHDATPTSSSIAQCSTATPSTCNNSNASPTALTGGIAGYPLLVGYDFPTGLGSLDIANFISRVFAINNLPPTLTVLTAAPTTITTSGVATFTAVVNAPGSIAGGTSVPTGSVQFASNGTNIGVPVALVAGATSSTAAVSAIPFTTAGTYAITAAYTGDANFSPSTGNLNFVVTTPVLPATTAALTGTASTITSQGSVGYTAAISSSASGTPTGTVQFTRTPTGGTSAPIGTPFTLATGKAVLPPMAFPIGTYTIGCSYSGDSSFSASTCNSVALTVTGLPTATTLSGIPATIVSTTPVLALATVATNMATGNPTGTITFTLDGDPRLPATVSNFSASSGNIYLGTGTHTICAGYSGDTVFAPSTTAPCTSIQVTPGPVTIALTAPATAFSFQAVPVTATISGLSVAVAATSTVSFFDGSSLLTTVTPSYNGTAGTATYSAGPLTPGTHTITAVFNGDTAYAKATSNAATIVVTAATVTLGPASTALTTKAGTPTTDVVIIASTNFTGSENLSCAVNFNGGTSTNVPTCTFNPATVTFTGTGSTTSTLTIGSVANPSAAAAATLTSANSGGFSALAGTAAFAFLFAFLPRRSRRALRAVRVLSLLCFLAALTALSGCGSGANTPPPAPGTTVGSYDITINANSDLNHTDNVGTSSTIHLTIQ